MKGVERKCYGQYYNREFITMDRDCAICDAREPCKMSSPAEAIKAVKLDQGKRKLSLIHPSTMGIMLTAGKKDRLKDAIYHLSEAAHANDDGDFIAFTYQALAGIISHIGDETTALELMTVAMEYGANKPEYGRNNWKKGMEWSRLIDAAQRHGLAVLAGEDVDKDSGNPHVAHMLASIHMLLGNHAMKVGTNDIY